MSDIIDTAAALSRLFYGVFLLWLAVAAVRDRLRDRPVELDPVHVYVALSMIVLALVTA